jgi:hypothetical protein
MAKKSLLFIFSLFISVALYAAQLPAHGYKAPPLPSDPGQQPLPIGNEIFLMIGFVLLYALYRYYPMIVKK